MSDIEARYAAHVQEIQYVCTEWKRTMETCRRPEQWKLVIEDMSLVLAYGQYILTDGHLQDGILCDGQKLRAAQAILQGLIDMTQCIRRICKSHDSRVKWALTKEFISLSICMRLVLEGTDDNDNDDDMLARGMYFSCLIPGSDRMLDATLTKLNHAYDVVTTPYSRGGHDQQGLKPWKISDRADLLTTIKWQAFWETYFSGSGVVEKKA